MKHCLLIGAVLLIQSIAFAQAPDKALLRVRYSFSHVRDTTNRGQPYTENMVLITGKNASLYTSHDRLTQSINQMKQIQEQLKNSAGGPAQIRIDRTGMRAMTQIDQYFFAKENKFITKENLFNNYLVEETNPQINWKIANDTMSFSGINCQKATAQFKGRNWIAWFAPDLPFQSGPWKLNGLPGLIIEAYDDKKEVQFLFAGTEKVEAQAAPAETVTSVGGTVLKLPGLDMGITSEGEIKLPADAIKTTAKELDKLKEARDKDPQGFMRAQMAARGMTGNFQIRGSGPGGAPGGAPGAPAAPVVNNPIELAGN